MRGKIYFDNSGVKYLVVNIARYADDCAIEFVFYTNIGPTHDAKSGDRWCMEKTAFIQRMKPSE